MALLSDGLVAFRLVAAIHIFSYWGEFDLSDSTKRPRDVVLVGRGIQPSHVRQTNQRAILSVISLQPGISNAELARVTDLAPQTVSAVLTDLEQLNLVTRGEVLRGRRGQPATPLYMATRYFGRPASSNTGTLVVVK